MNFRLSILAFFLVLLNTSFSQVISLEQPELMVLYRGYPNQMLVNIPETSELSVNDISVTGTNVSISKVNKPGGYIVKPAGGKIAVIVLKKRVGDSLQEIYRTEYRVSNLPDPVLFWGGSKSGTKASKSSRALLAKYPPEIPLKAAFRVTKWTLSCNGEKATGVSGSLGPSGTIIVNTTEGSQVAITATVVGPDGIARQIGGAWSL